MNEMDILRHILTENGIVALLLSVAVLWQTRQLANERKDNKELNNLILQLATSQVAANKEIQALLERLIDLIPLYLGGHNENKNI